MKSYINDLFKYLDTYEKDYSKFETEAFLQTYNGIVTVFKSLRSDRNQAVEADYYLLDKIKMSPLTSSDLRQLTVQVLISRFESEADNDGRSNQAYSYCRGLRPVKQDITFFEKNLLQLLFSEGGLNNNFRLNTFFLNEIAYFMNNFGRSVRVDLNPEEFECMSAPVKLLELQRRRLALGVDLIKDRTSLEFHLQRVNAIDRLGAKSKLCERYLTEWNYLAKTSWWSRFTEWISELGAKLRGAFSSFGYFRLLSNQRKPAYFKYVLIIIIFLAVAVGVPAYWNSYAAKKLQQFQQKANELHSIRK
ncbi:MAG: hypothetical protein OEW00_02495 [candidate division Zixibacteria bacterium]|nr:hypothetical protein [candidate division Zixibacteria bacterium]